MAFFLGLLSGLKSSNVAAGHRVTWRFTFLSLVASLKPDPAATCRGLSSSAHSPLVTRGLGEGALLPTLPAAAPGQSLGRINP